MVNKKDPIMIVVASLVAIQAGMALTTLSYVIGNLMGFGSIYITSALLEKFTTYDDFLSAWMTSIAWQFGSYIVILSLPKWYIYTRSVTKKRYSLFVYLVLPWVVFFTLDGFPKALAFILIATLAIYEAFLHNWMVNPPAIQKK